jgi:hypothetical protein
LPVQKSGGEDETEKGVPSDWMAWIETWDLDGDDPDLADKDPDEDGLSNLEEYKNETNPTLADTDGDGYNDGLEVKEGSDPRDARDHPAKKVPVLQADSPQVSYDSTTGDVSVEFAFDIKVTAIAEESDSWDIEGDESKTITARPKPGAEAGQALPITLTVANSEDEEAVTVLDPVTVGLVNGVFIRSGEAATYTVSYYDDNGVVALEEVSGDSSGSGWYYVADSGLKQIFNAVYTPNKPDSVDSIEGGKTALTYTEDISEAALALFNITIGAEGGEDKIEIKGTSLPADAAASSTNLIVVDIGLPGGEEDNSGLPKFIIPYEALGQADKQGEYGGIRFRVNRGAEAVIEADNSDYEADGKGHPCDAGNFTNGCIEVMAGGKLRDGAYEGFPLGANAVLLNRLGSYLAVGPEEAFEATDGGDLWFAGWLIGPEEVSPRIVWDGGDQNGGYIEVRPGKLAISANVTVKKTLGLIYSVWFVNGPIVTIDAQDDSLTPPISGKKGLFANGNRYKFYGTADAKSGGQNPGSPAAKIIVKAGSVLHKAFLTNEEDDLGMFIGNDDSDVTIINLGKDGAVPEEYEHGISGYLNWDIPEDVPVL